MSSRSTNSSTKVYSFLGPVGTFTELALRQVAEAKGAVWNPAGSVDEALTDVISGKAFRAVVPVESSVEGGVSATLDALANVDGLRIFGEYLVPVNFNLVARPGIKLADVKTIAVHPMAYGQVRGWLKANLPKHHQLQATSNAAAASLLLESDQAEAAISTPNITDHYKLKVLAKNIGDNKHATTRFILVGKPSANPKPTGADKTSIIVELPTDRPGTLLEMLEQFAVRGVNLTRIESRPIGDRLGRYRFNVDAEGHVNDEAVGEALAGLHRFSPKVIFLGSYPSADQEQTKPSGNNSNREFGDAKTWLAQLRK